jgi:hypothetical protein
MQNRPAQVNNTSGYKGVYFNKKNNKWVAAICINRKTTYLGCFINPKEASEAYKAAALNIHKEFARF